MLSTLDVVARLRTASRDQQSPRLTAVKPVGLNGIFSAQPAGLGGCHPPCPTLAIDGQIRLRSACPHALYLLTWFLPPEPSEQDSTSLRGPLHSTIEVCALPRVTQGDRRGLWFLPGVQQGQLGLWSSSSTSSLFSHPRCQWRKPEEDCQVAESVMGRKGGKKDTQSAEHAAVHVADHTLIT